ncbi:MAG: hypothetical protein EOP62_21615 [Sphingomonadales bacterium]|nr:MAG: hypothetical protein EOP62_21615 [Sphingomonadales bacterium]
MRNDSTFHNRARLILCRPQRQLDPGLAPTTYMYFGEKIRAERLSPDRERAKTAGMAAAVKAWSAKKP